MTSQFYLCKSVTLYTIYTGLATYYFAFGEISQNYWLSPPIFLVNLRSGIGMSRNINQLKLTDSHVIPAKPVLLALRSPAV
jgi:hypothetical protein